MRTHPSCEFFVTDGQVYYNNIPYVSGTINQGACVPVTSGYASLYEMNVDRISGSTNRFIGGKSEPNTPYDYTLIDPGDGRDPVWVAGPGAVPGVGDATQYGYSQTSAAGLQAWWLLNSTDFGSPSDETGTHDASLAVDYIPTATVSIFHSTPTTEPPMPLYQTAVAPFGPAALAIQQEGLWGQGLNIGTAATWDAIIGNDTGGGSTQKMTFAIWIKKTGDNAVNGTLFSFGDTAGALGNLLFYSDNSEALWFEATWDDAAVGWKTDALLFERDNWAHIVVTYDATDSANIPIIYVNGIAHEVTLDDGTQTGTYNGIEVKDGYIGNSSAFYNAFDGLLAQASIWNVILSPTEILALYEAARGGGVYADYGGYVHSEIIDNGLIYPYVTKDGSRVSLNTVTTGSSYDLDFQYGDVVSGSYPLSASIKRELIGWYPKANGGNPVSTFLENIGPYERDYSGGSWGAGQLDTGYLYLLPADVSLTETQVDGNLPDGETYAPGQQCAQPSKTWYYSYADDGGLTYGLTSKPAGISCNSPKWPHYWALKNTLNNNAHLSQHYAVTGATSQYSTPEWIKDQQIINLISIPSIFYGSKIKPGSVSLRWYLTGTLIAELQDTKQNGELIEITTSNPYIEQYGAGNVAGVVLYNEGFILLTGSWALNEAKGAWSESTKKYNGGMITIRSGSGNTPYSPMWIDWGAGTNDNTNKLTTSTSGNIGAGSATGVPPLVVSASNNFESASFGLSFKGTSDTQVLTMFANARRGEANFSNNPTYLSHTASTTSSFTTSSYAYVENPGRLVYSFASSSAMDHSASYKREVYISRVGIYDENKNLIGVATMADPVRKAEDEDLTFKLKLDI